MDLSNREWPKKPKSENNPEAIRFQKGVDLKKFACFLVFVIQAVFVKSSFSSVANPK